MLVHVVRCFVCMCVCMYVCMYVWVCVCMLVCVCVLCGVYVCTYKCVYVWMWEKHYHGFIGLQQDVCFPFFFFFLGAINLMIDWMWIWSLLEVYDFCGKWFHSINQNKTNKNIGCGCEWQICHKKASLYQTCYFELQLHVSSLNLPGWTLDVGSLCLCPCVANSLVSLSLCN